MSEQNTAEQMPAVEEQPETKPSTPPASQENTVDQSRIFAALSYFGLLLIVPLLLARDNDFVKFHLKQGIAWFVAWLVASFIMWIPLLGWTLGVAMFAVSVFAAIQAYEGKRWEMPYVAKYAKMIKL